MNLASDLAFDLINRVDQKKTTHILRQGKGKTQRMKKDVYFSPSTERMPSNYYWYVFFYVFVQSRTLQLPEYPVSRCGAFPPFLKKTCPGFRLLDSSDHDILGPVGK